MTSINLLTHVSGDKPKRDNNSIIVVIRFKIMLFNNIYRICGLRIGNYKLPGDSPHSIGINKQ